MSKLTDSNLNLAIMLCTLPQWPKRETAALALNTPSDHDERYHRARNWSATTDYTNSLDRGMETAFNLAQSDEVPQLTVTEIYCDLS